MEAFTEVVDASVVDASVEVRSFLHVSVHVLP